jgi:phage portal protein BeeE
MGTFTIRQFGRLASDFYETIFGGKGKTFVTPQNALSFPPIWYAVSKISGHIGQLPLVLHRRLPEGGNDTADTLQAYRLMKIRPNGWQTPMVFKRQLQSHALLFGNAYAFIVRRGSMITDLYPLDPARMGITIYEGEKYYVYDSDKDEPIRQIRDVNIPNEPKIPNGGGLMVLTDTEVMHIPGLGFDGYAGFSLWKIASENWSIGIHADRRMRAGFEKGFKSSMLLEAPQGVMRDEKDAREFIENFNKVHSGSGNADRVGLLREGIKANVVSMSGADAQVIENRRYARQDAALWFLLETILGDDSSVSYNSLEQKNLGYLSNCLSTWLVLWEQECNRKLLTEREQADHYFKFHDRALLRTSHKEQLDSLAKGIAATIYSPNEARDLLDMNPYEGGDSHSNPAVTPGAPGGTQEDDDDTDEEPPEMRAARIAMTMQMDCMLSVEVARIEAIAKKPEKFCDAIEAFYKSWQTRLESLTERLAMPVELAAAYCDERKQSLDDLAGRVTADELADAVSALVKDWKSTDMLGAKA